MLFTQKENEDFLVARNGPLKFRSVPYITSHDFNGATVRGATYPAAKFLPGMPLPLNSSTGGMGQFWLELGKPLGGLVTDAGGVQFGVPNLVYDYEVPFMMDGYSSPTDKIHIVKTVDSLAGKDDAAVGLYSTYQFNRFRGSALNPNTAISPETIDHEIARVRGPTSYEAANYMIPTPNDFNVQFGLDSFGFINGDKEPLNNGYERYRSKVYAPLYRKNDQNDLLYKGPGEVQSAIINFMMAQESGMKKYKMAMNQGALAIYKERNNVSGSATGSRDGYIRAANGVSDINFATPEDSTDLTQTPKSCKSLAGEFLYFYWAEVKNSEAPQDDPAGCPTPLAKLLEQYFSQQGTNPSYDPNYYSFDFSWKANQPKEENLKFMSAYTPGPFTGVSRDGQFDSPLPGAPAGDTMRRNTYSTKFVSLDSLRDGGGRSYSNDFPTISEGQTNPASDDTSKTSFRNTLEAESVGLDLSSVKY